MPEFVHDFIHHSLPHAALDTLKLIPFLFLAYLLMEAIEHKAEGKAERLMRRSGALSPIVGGTLGLLPQCGFSAAAAGLYAGRVITVGTLFAVFLTTSDEMLLLMLSEGISPTPILVALGYKLAVGIIVGILLDLLLRLRHKTPEAINIDDICERENCHCEHGMLLSALLHTLRITAFIFIFSLVIESLVHTVGTDKLSALGNIPVLSHAAMALVGLIPNCAASVALTTAYLDGIISFGAMIAGLLPGAGVGILVLCRLNRPVKRSILIIATLYLVGILFGLLADLLPFAI